MSDENLTLEEKVDEILKYQRRMYRAQIIKSVINFILFMVFIVLPIVWLIYWLRSVDLTGIMDTYNNLKESTGGIEKLNEALKSLSY
jgi:predicted nucleic acid-binding Zn ribbon protein